MVFSSLFFIGVFLPLFLFIYYICPSIKAKNVVLTVFSLVFYASGGLAYLILLIVMSLIGYFVALNIDIVKDEHIKKKHLATGIIIVILNLVLFKYTGFAVDTFNMVFKTSFDVLALAMPIGISFYTFKLISYMVDVYRGTISPCKSFLPVLLYTSTFHHSLQGPIVRMSEMRKAIYARKIDAEGVSYGVMRFVFGLGKKLLLADPIGAMADSLVPLGSDLSNVPVTGVWLGVACFSIQLYLDFSGYSDMAIGLGRMIGFSYPENFRYPYAAGSVKEFWRRWHISLSSFFRDYVYIPLGGSRVSAGRVVINLLVVWALTGLWHGAGWNFILWGLYYFVLLNIEKVIKPTEHTITRILWYPVTVVLVFFGWLLFRFTDASSLFTMIKGFFGIGNVDFYAKSVGLVLKNNIFLFICGCLASTPVFAMLAKSLEKYLKKQSENTQILEILKIVLIIVIVVLCVFTMTGNSFTPFMYEKF